jgi:hypothetical protein
MAVWAAVFGHQNREPAIVMLDGIGNHPINVAMPEGGSTAQLLLPVLRIQIPQRFPEQVFRAPARLAGKQAQYVMRHGIDRHGRPLPARHECP